MGKVQKIIMVLMSGLILIGCSNKIDSYEIINMFQEDPSKAIEVYSKLNDKDKLQVNNDIVEKANQKYEQFYNEEVEISETFQFLRNFGEVEEVKDEIDSIRSNMNILIMSKDNYEDGEFAYNNGYYSGAILSYEKVDQMSPYYDDALAKAKICQKLFNGKEYVNPNAVEPYIGMLESEIKNCIWGDPEDINETITKYGTKKQYVYSNYRYLYFEDGVLTAIQK